MSEHSNDSDDEAPPEQLSFNVAKTTAEEETKLRNEKKRQDKEFVKEKRRQRQELFKAQKLEKETRLNKLIFTDEVLDQIRNEGEVDKTAKSITPANEVLPISTDHNFVPPSPKENHKKHKPHSKAYKELNIDVKSLNKIQNPRREAAISFKTKRFGKIHRESVSINFIHAEKLKAAGKI